jgi:hypothetical protein
VVAAKQTNGDIKLTWTPAVPIPGTPAITGYRAHAISQTSTTVSGNSEQLEIGKRIIGGTAAGTTLTGLSAPESYDVEVVSVSSTGQTFPPIQALPQVDVTPPVVSVSPTQLSSPNPVLVNLTANEAGSDIFFTTDGTSPVTDGGGVSDTAVLFTAPITIAATTTIRFAAFDPSGNLTLGETTFTITNDPTPAAPVFGPATVGQGSITLNWTPATENPPPPPITGYIVQVYDQPTGGTPLLTQPATASPLTITGLTADTAYYVSIKAQNVNGFGPESARLGPLTPQGAVTANAGPDQSVNRRTTPTTVNLSGAGSTPGATYSWTQITNGANDPDRVTITGAATLTPSFVLPLYSYPMTNNPLTFRLTVTNANGSKTDDVKVTPIPDQVAIATAKWKTNDFRVTGSDSLVGTTIKVHRGTLAGPVLGQVAVTAAAPPATGGVFDLRLRNAAAGATNPGTIWIESSAGGTAGPFTVTNG